MVATNRRMSQAISTPKEYRPLPSEDYVSKAMPKILGTGDMLATFIVSIFLVTTATTAVSGGPAAITYLLLACIVFFVPCIVATLQLGLMFPHEGSLYNWTHHAIGGRASFFAGFCAWFPGVLIASSLADLLVTYIQSMNSGWLTQTWQQGLVISAVLALTGILSIQRFRTVQNIINVLVCLTVFACCLIGLSCIIWLLTRHAPITNFGHSADWLPNSDNFVLFGFMIFAYIGTEGPLNLAGEMQENKKTSAIKQHLFWGGILIVTLYMITTISILVVLGPTNGATPFALVSVVETVLGHFWGSVTAVCFMGSFVATGLVYNYVFARILQVGAIDGRLPVGLAKLNIHRVPARAILIQAAMAIIFILLAFVIAPYIGIGDPEVFPIQLYNVSQAAAVLVWAISAMFLFFDLIGCIRRYRAAFERWLFLPMPLLWVCIVLGLVSCIVAIVDTLRFSWITQISNNQWWLLVGGLTLLFLTVALIGSMYANSEAAWESMEV
ncbi:MAG: APC family permease [Ktedonobacteraceae bacterium]